MRLWVRRQYPFLILSAHKLISFTGSVVNWQFFRTVFWTSCILGKCLYYSKLSFTNSTLFIPITFKTMLASFWILEHRLNCFFLLPVVELMVLYIIQLMISQSHWLKVGTQFILSCAIPMKSNDREKSNRIVTVSKSEWVAQFIIVHLL